LSKYDSVDDYIKNQDEWKGNTISKLRQILKKSAPNVKELIKWSQPVFEDDNGPFCFMKAHKNHVNIGFWRGAVLKDPYNILEGEGTKMRHVKIFQDTKINEEALTSFIKQALKLNEELGDPSR
jgi:hypothetical protein